jgi:hypothetical protein
MSLLDANLWYILPDSLEGDLNLMKDINTELIINIGTQNAQLYIWSLTKDSMVCNLDKYKMTLVRIK